MSGRLVEYSAHVLGQELSKADECGEPCVVRCLSDLRARMMDLLARRKRHYRGPVTSAHSTHLTKSLSPQRKISPGRRRERTSSHGPPVARAYRLSGAV